MKKLYIVLIMILIASGSFLTGSWLTYQGGREKATAERKILHYVDPMNPALKSDKPGIAPCGMPLEPVYADQGDAAGGAGLQSSMPPGTVRISPEKQQLIGVKTTTVEKSAWSHTLRVLGRVVPDETRTYRINAAANGWIEEALPVTTGSLVKENEILATYYSLEYRNLVQNYFNLITITKEGVPGEKAVTRTSRYSTGQLRQLREAASAMGQAVSESSQIDYYRRNLYNFGMSPYQVDEMERTRTIPDFIEIRAPIAGFILYRNVSVGLRFDRGAEFFRIADLSRVWILADIFETEASYFKPGMRVKMELPYQKKILYAEVSSVLPQFDPATRTLKVRLEADNPGFVMRPDMFVNVELPVTGAPAIIVPVDAVLDSGLKRTVFVDKGSGFFEPRQVETGRSLGERVEIVRGLMPGEKIVVSGNFLIDSEARMQQAASGIIGKIGRDLVCLMNIDEDRSKAEGNVREYKNKNYFFCSPECRDEFGKDPERYLKPSPVKGKMEMPGSAAHDGMAMPGGQTGMMPAMPASRPKAESKAGGKAASGIAGRIGRDPVCGMNIDEDRARTEGNFLEYRGQTYFFCEANDRELFRKDPERYLKPSPVKGKMEMPGSAAHDGMAMPGGQTGMMPAMPAPRPQSESQAGGKAASGSAISGPAGMPMPQGAMPGMSAPSPGSESRTGRVVGPSSMPAPHDAMPGMTRERTIQGPDDRPIPLPQGAMPGMSAPSPGSGSRTGRVVGPSSMPAPYDAMPGMTRERTIQGPDDRPIPLPPQGAGPMPGPQPGGMSPSLTAPGMSPESPDAPGSGGMSMPQKSAPPSAVWPDEIVPSAPATRTPRRNLRDPRNRLPGGDVPQTGMPKAAPRPGSTLRGVIPPGAATMPGVGPTPQSFPPSGGALPQGTRVAPPVTGANAGETSPPGPGTPEEKQ